MSIFQRLKSHLSLETIAATLVVVFGLLLRHASLCSTCPSGSDEAMLAR